jgi:hypothetical protein
VITLCSATKRDWSEANGHGRRGGGDKGRRQGPKATPSEKSSGSWMLQVSCACHQENQQSHLVVVGLAILFCTFRLLVRFPLQSQVPNFHLTLTSLNPRLNPIVSWMLISHSFVNAVSDALLQAEEISYHGQYKLSGGLHCNQ